MIKVRRFNHGAVTQATLICIFFLSSPAKGDANGIDCSKAATRIDHLICANPALLAQDSQMSRLAKNILRNTATPDLAKEFLAQQRTWLQARNDICVTGTTRCLLTAYEKRNLTLAILTDRIGTAPLTDIQPVIMTGTWSVPNAITMMSPADNPNHESFDNNLDGNPNFNEHKNIGLSADGYWPNGLPLPGSTITSESDGSTCFKGQNYSLHGDGPVEIIPANFCTRYGWQAIALKDIPNRLPLATVRYIYTLSNPDPLDWLTDSDLSIIENDLKIKPNTIAFIGFVTPSDALARDGRKPTAPTVLLIKAADGGYYAPVVLDMVGSPPSAIFTIGYQKWLPTSADAGMKILSNVAATPQTEQNFDKAGTKP